MILLDATRSNKAMQHTANTVDELRGDMHGLMEGLDEIKDDMGEIKDDMGDIKDDLIEIKCSCSVILLPP